LTPQAPRSAPSAPSFRPSSPGKVLAAPATRRRAREMGVDLATLEGSGPSGRVTNEDLARHVEGAGGAAPAAPPAEAPAPAARRHAPVSIAAAPQGATEERIPFRGLRRKIA